MAKVISLVNQKGGVGKTTTSINLSSALGHLGKKVLLIDLDPQSNSTTGLGINKANIKLSIYDVITNRCEISDAIIKTKFKNLSVIPSMIFLSGVEIELMQTSMREDNFILGDQLKNQINKIKDRYDFIIIDCPPALGILTTNALAASDSVLIPVQCEYLSLHGLVKITSMIDEVKEDLNNNVKISGIIATMFQSISGLNKEVLQTLQENYSSLLFKTPIRRTVSLADAQAENRDIFLSNINSNGAYDYWNLCKEIVEQERSITNE